MLKSPPVEKDTLLSKNLIPIIDVSFGEWRIAKIKSVLIGLSCALSIVAAEQLLRSVE